MSIGDNPEAATNPKFRKLLLKPFLQSAVVGLRRPQHSVLPYCY